MGWWKNWVARNVINDDPMDDEHIRWEARQNDEPWFSIYGGDILTALRDVAFGADPEVVYAQLKEDSNAY